MNIKYKHKKKRKEGIKLILVKSLVLILLLVLLGYASTYILSPGVKISIDKGYSIEKEGRVIFAKSFPPNLEQKPTTRIIVENLNKKEEEITLRIRYEGKVEKVIAERVEIKENEVYIYLSLDGEDRRVLYLVGEISIEDPLVYKGFILPQEEAERKDAIEEPTGNKEVNKEKDGTGGMNEEAKGNRGLFYEVDLGERVVLDEYTFIMLSLSLLLLIVSSLIIASFSPKERKRVPPIKPGEIVFTE